MRRRFDRIFDKTSQYGQAWDDYKAQNPLSGKFCACGQPAQARHHVISARRNGPHAEFNVENLCNACHALQHPHLQRQRRRP